MKSNKYLFYISLLFLTVFIIGGCYQNTQVEQAIQLQKKIDNWKPPKINMTKKQVIQYYSDNREKLDPIEGIWIKSISFTTKGKYDQRIKLPDLNERSTFKNTGKYAIIKDPSMIGYNFILFYFENLDMKSGLEFGEICGYVQSALSNNSYDIKMILGPKSITWLNPTISFTLTNNNSLFGKKESVKKLTYSQYSMATEYLFIKEPFPFEDNKDVEPSDENIYTGSGFMFSESGFIATNYHVIKDKSNIDIILPKYDKTLKAIIVLKDISNDLAILKITNFNYSELFSYPIPFSFGHPNEVKIGQEVFTLGFPLGEILGKSAKLSTGTINSLYGIQDDPRLFQISNPIQPGNSGGPLFNKNGELLGIVVYSLNAKYFYESANIIPQNVNFAIKSDYLLNLVSMLPEYNEIKNRQNKLIDKNLETQIELLVPFIVNIKAK